MILSLPELKAALGGTIVGRQVVAPGPGHSPRDRSLAVRPSEANPLGFIVTSYANDDWRECRDHVAERLGLDLSAWKASHSSSDILVDRERRRQLRVQAEQDEAADRERRIGAARRIWAAAVDPISTIVETYLRSRALDLPAEIAGEVIRFHPRCPFGPGVRLPAMVAGMLSVETGELTAIHRTALTDDGRKIDRKMLGVSEGAAVMLDRVGVVQTTPTSRVKDVSTSLSDLVVGEGVETGMSARQLGIHPVWCFGSVGKIARLPVLPGVSTLILLEERDESGASLQAVTTCGTRWREAERTVHVIRPPAGCSDLNDMLVRRAAR